MTTIDTHEIHDMLEEILDGAPTHVQAIEIRLDRWWVELATRATDECSHCGQSLGPAGPVAWMDRQGGSGPGGWWEIRGAHDQQHGCGTWNTPVATDETIDVAGLEAQEIEDRLRALVQRHRNEVDAAR